MSVFRASSLFPPLFYEFRPRSIEASCQLLSLLVASPEGLTPEPNCAGCPSPKPAPRASRRCARGELEIAPGGVGRKVHLKFLLCCRCCQAPCAHFFFSHQLQSGCRGECCSGVMCVPNPVIWK